MEYEIEIQEIRIKKIKTTAATLSEAISNTFKKLPSFEDEKPMYLFKETFKDSNAENI